MVRTMAPVPFAATPRTHSAGTVGASLEKIHACIRRHYAAVERIAVALYDPRSDRLTTFVNSTEGGNPLEHYEAFLEDVPSLGELAASADDRVIDDLTVFASSPHEHSRRLLEKGYRSSYARALRDGDRLRGFLFFDAREPGYFRKEVRERLAIFGGMVASAVAESLSAARLLDSLLRVASRLTHLRDPETAAHLQRMSRYARLIARHLAAREGLSDEFVELLFHCAPIHDVGKIAVPDEVLFKQGRLSEPEFDVMKTHVTKGEEIVEAILREVDAARVPEVGILRNVVLFHHETMDGGGYPRGLSGDAIPLEARIVAVADVFDALTSRRCYKPAWRSDEAFAYLTEARRGQFDAACVAALRADGGGIDAIRLLFPDAEVDAYQSRDGYSPDL